MSRNAKGVRAARVRHIAEMMGELRYTGTREQCRALADEWGVTPSAVRHYAAEAHRMLSFEPGKRDELRNNLNAMLLDIIGEIRETDGRVTGHPDWRALLEAMEQYRRYAGLEETADAGGGRPARIDVVLTPAAAQVIGEETAKANPPAGDPNEPESGA